MISRQPRIEDAAHLASIRKMPCLVCGRPGPSDPAHIRSASRQYGKRLTGLGEKPSDQWVLPMCRRCHEDQHRWGNELGWWGGKGIPDPFAVALALYGNRTPPRPRRRIVKTKRKPPEERARIVGRPLVSRSNWPTGRKLQSRKMETVK